MGVCHSDNKKDQNAARDIKNKSDTVDAHTPTKLLLLGAGDVGKSTFFKQIKFLYNDGYTKPEKEDFVPVVHQNIITNIQILLQQLEPYGDQLSPQNTKFKDRIINLQHDYRPDEEDTNHLIDDTLAHQINTLWQDIAIQRIYKSRREKALNRDTDDNAGYFLNQINVVSNKGYIPTNEDIIRCKARTTGIVEQQVTAEESKMVVYDMGGQRAERRKWLHCRENVSGIVYFSSASAYDQPLVEDEGTNRLSEDVNLFQDVLEMFPNKAIILILCKKDLLREKLADSKARPVSDFHGGYDKSRANDPMAYTLEWMETEFLSRAKQAGDRKVTVFHLNATDGKESQKVFLQIKQILAACSAD